MKNSTIAKTALALVLGMTVASASAYTETFEGFETNSLVASLGAPWSSGGQDESKIDTTGTDKFLSLNTEGDTITNKFDVSPGGLKELLDAQLANPPSGVTPENPGISIKQTVKFVPSDELQTFNVADNPDIKFAVYAYCPIDGTETNLVVTHLHYTDDPGNESWRVTNTVTSISIEPDEEVELDITLKRFYEGYREMDTDAIAFSVKANGVTVTNSAAYKAETFLEDFAGYTSEDGNWFITMSYANGSDVNRLGVTALNYSGTGAIDDIEVALMEADEPDEAYAAGDAIPGEEGTLTAAQAAWLNQLTADKGLTKAQMDSALATGDNDGVSLAFEYLLNLDPTVASVVEFGITSIDVSSDVAIGLSLSRKENGVEITKPILGTLKLYGATEPGGTYSQVATVSETFATTQATTHSFTANGAKFFKAVIE